MPYCPRCGVEVEARLSRCPLCETKIPEEVRPDQASSGDYPSDTILPKPYGKILTEQQKRRLSAGLLLFLIIFPIATTLGIDLLQNLTISWSYYVILPLAGLAIMIWIFRHYWKKPLITVNTLFLAAFIYHLLLGFRGRLSAFFTSEVLVIYLISLAAAEALLQYLVRRKARFFQIVAFSVLDAAAVVLCLDGFLSPEVDWAWVVLSVLLPISLFFAYLKWTKKKGLNLAGFFFLSAGLLLLAIDYTTSWILDWSLITGFILVTLSVLSFILHFTLFSDIDWKKALHL